jgi:hypothetical protein
MNKAFNFLADNIKYFFLLYLAIQVLVLILRFPINYTGDSAYYFRLAQDCVYNKGIYPLPAQMFEEFLVVPLYINLTALILFLFNSTFSIGIFNIVLNSIQLFLLFKITEIVINRKSACIAALLYMLYLNNLGMIVLNISELFFTTLILCSLYFFLKNNKWNYLLSGIFCGASIAVRPVGWALLFSYIVISIYKYYKERKTAAPVFVLLGTAGFILVFGFFIKMNTGEFIYSAANGPINILMGANDKADGGFYPGISYVGNPGFIPNSEKLTFRQKQDIWEYRAVTWIKEHPVRWTMLLPVKVFLMFRWDDISVSRIVSDDLNYQKVIKIIKHDTSLKLSSLNYSAAQLALWGILITYHHLYYSSLMLFFIYGLIRFRKPVFTNSNLNLLLIFAIVGIIITIIAVGDVRYKYPYMFILFIMNSSFLSEG